MLSWASFWQCCEPVEDKGDQVVFQSATDEGMHIPTLLPQGPNKDRGATCETKKAPHLVAPSSGPSGAPFETSTKTDAKEREAEVKMEPGPMPEEHAQVETGGTGMPMVSAEGSSAKGESEDHSWEDVDAALVSESLDSAADAELQAKREECIQTARSRSQSRHLIADHDDERERLETLVAAFSRSAVRGCACTYFDYRTGKLTTATYQVNADLTHLTIAEPSNGRRSLFKRNGLPLELPLASIIDVDTFEDCSMCLETKVVKRLQPAEKECFVMIFYDSNRTRRTEMCSLLLDGVQSRDNFQQSLRVLKGGD